MMAAIPPPPPPTPFSFPPAPSPAAGTGKPDLVSVFQNAVQALNQTIAGQPDADGLLGELVRLAGQALGAGGAGVWITDMPEKPQLIIEQNMAQLGLLNGQVVLPGLNTAVRRCVREAKPLIVPPFFVDSEAGDMPVNPSPLELLLVPMTLRGKVAMVLGMAVPPPPPPPPGESDASMHRTYLSFLGRMAGAVETSLSERHISLIEQDRGRSSKLVRFADEVHRHLYLQQVAYDIANLSRDLLEAERTTVELYPRLKQKIVAVSNVDEPNKRAGIFHVQRLIFDYVRDRQAPVVLDRAAAEGLVSDPVLQDAAAAYFGATEFEAFLAEPIRADEAGAKVLGVLLVEYGSGKPGARSQNPEGLSGAARAQANAQLVGDVVRLSSSAVANALEHESIPLRKTLHAVSQLWRKPTGSRKALAATMAGITVALAVGLGVVPFEFAIRVDCQVRPSAQLSIAAPVEQRILDIPVRAGTHVYPRPGRDPKPEARSQKSEDVVPLAVFDSTELVAARAEQVGKLGELQVQLKEAERKGEIARIGGVKLQVEQVEKQISVLDHQIEQCEVWSPIEGTVLTEKVEGKKWSTPRKGEPLMEVASFSDWELVADVPESEVATVQAALAKAARQAVVDGHEDRGIEVDYVLYPWPDQRYAVHARGVAALLPASMQSHSANVFRLQVKLDAKSLPAGISMSGVTGRAKIHVGRAPLAWQWTRGAMRLARMMMFW